MVENKPLITLRNLRKRYGADELATEILRGIDLEIHAGEFVAIMGASGSGKSTLMHMLGCLDQPSAGEYWFNGQNVALLNSDELAQLRRQTFGFIFQSYHLIGSCSALENVEIPAVYAGVKALQRHQRAIDLLTKLGLEAHTRHRPSQLSGGQQQRVSIARALMNGGQIILADEPTGALDSQSGAEVMALLKQLAQQGHTIVLITHDPEVAAHAQRQITVRDGQVISDTGTASTLTPAPIKPGSYKETNDHHGTEIIEAWKMAIRSLQANLSRTLLTLLGVMIGVASVVAMLAIGEGSKQAVLERINAMGSNLVMIREQSRGRMGTEALSSLTAKDAHSIALLPNIIAALPENNGNVTARFGNFDINTEVSATSWEFPTVRNWPAVWGSFFNADDEQHYAAVAVLGQTVASGLFPNQDPLGHYILLNNVPFQVIGVMEEKGATGWGRDADDVIFVPLSTGNLRLFGQSQIRNITVSVDRVEAMEQTEQAITRFLDQRYPNANFRVRNMADIVAAVSETQNTFTVLLGSIAAISLLVGGIGVMNIMLVSVTERTHEIGIRVATGARTRNILQQFLTEAVVVSTLGGIVGIGLGIVAGLSASVLGMSALFSVPTMILAFACAVGTGLIFGFTPALKAARLRPVEALST